MRAFMAGLPLCIRNDSAVRPWQHVLDPVVAYLVLAERLFASREADEGWNFGPPAESEVSVSEIADRIVRLWGSGARWEKDGARHPHEATYLRLDCSKAAERLSWRSLLDLESALRLTVDWYRAFERGDDMRAVTQAHIDDVLNKASSGSIHRVTLAATEKTDPTRPSRDIEVAREQQ
jgi:CDP-glucose 4,6-dehydratase